MCTTLYFFVVMLLEDDGYDPLISSNRHEHSGTKTQIIKLLEFKVSVSLSLYSNL